MAKRKKGGRGKRRPPPKCKAILICDEVIIDSLTGKPSIIGVFRAFVVPRLPGNTKPCKIYLQLLGGIGQCNVTIEVHDLRENKVIARASGLGIAFHDRLNSLDVAVPMPPLRVLHDGQYEVAVFADGELVDQQRFTVLDARKLNDGVESDEEGESR